MEYFKSMFTRRGSPDLRRAVTPDIDSTPLVFSMDDSSDDTQQPCDPRMEYIENELEHVKRDLNAMRRTLDALMRFVPCVSNFADSNKE